MTAIPPKYPSESLITKFAAELADELAHAKSPVTPEVARSAAIAHLTEGKDKSMAVLVAAGVPMTRKENNYGASKYPCSWYTVNGRTIFIG